MLRSILSLATLILTASALRSPLLQHSTGRNVSAALFSELEELARIVDISYCVGLISAGISKPFSCLSRCSDFPQFDLVTTWNTGPLLSDSCGYIALDHGKQRIIVAFRGTYSIANTIIDLSTIPQKYVPYPGDDGDVDVTVTSAKCTNCSVHMGFYSSWVNTRRSILSDLQQQIFLHPHYALHLVGHSLGGAVAALAGLDFVARGWEPTVTSFGEPRVGNTHLAEYIDETFKIGSNHSVPQDDTELKYRRVTHVDDPVPLLPLTEWGYAMHAGEIYISKSSLSPDVADLQHCSGDNDVGCIAGQDSSTAKGPSAKRDLLESVRNEIEDVRTESWGIPSRYKLWELFFAHRDYFWRLGVCLPGGDPLGPGKLIGSQKVDL